MSHELGCPVGNFGSRMDVRKCTTVAENGVKTAERSRNAAENPPLQIQNPKLEATRAVPDHWATAQATHPPFALPRGEAAAIAEHRCPHERAVRTPHASEEGPVRGGLGRHPRVARQGSHEVAALEEVCDGAIAAAYGELPKGDYGGHTHELGCPVMSILRQQQLEPRTWVPGDVNTDATAS